MATSQIQHKKISAKDNVYTKLNEITKLKEITHMFQMVLALSSLLILKFTHAHQYQNTPQPNHNIHKCREDHSFYGHNKNLLYIRPFLASELEKSSMKYFKLVMHKFRWVWNTYIAHFTSRKRELQWF
jgi:hypothetical protein